MKFSRITAVIALLSLMALPVMAELTDYQKGVYDGLSAGGQIGYLRGAAPYDATAAQQYGSLVNQYNAWLQSVFGDNQTAINNFLMQPYTQTTATGYQAYPSISTKPVHSIDSSWNQTAKYNPDAKGKIFGYDPDTYYTMVGWNNVPNAPIDSATGKPIDSSLQPP
jgi:hypothetical protein